MQSSLNTDNRHAVTTTYKLTHPPPNTNKQSFQHTQSCSTRAGLRHVQCARPNRAADFS